MSPNLSATIPAEPAQGSVVLDTDGLSWQRHEIGWMPSRLSRNDPNGPVYYNAVPWPHLLFDRGPLNLIHTPPDSPTS